jgi:hypothetical protein
MGAPEPLALLTIRKEQRRVAALLGHQPSTCDVQRHSVSSVTMETYMGLSVVNGLYL